MKKARSNYRQEMADIFIKALEEDPYTFITGWNFAGTGTPKNPATKKAYNGINRLYLKYIENDRGYEDNRWMTFNQIDEAGYHLKKGSRGAKVEYWMPFDEKEKKWISWEKYKEFMESEESDEGNPYVIKQKLYTVFNGSCIEGLPKLEKLKLNDISDVEVVNRVSEALGVKINESSTSNQAYYSPSTDEITVPIKGQFKSQQDYAKTCLHELGHSTGHKSRLDRDQTGSFGTAKYAFEELIAEISSCFMGEYIAEPITEQILENHKAYIQSWAASIKEDKNFLFNAIKEAEKASDYMIDKANLQELKKEQESELDVSETNSDDEINSSLSKAKALINKYCLEEFEQEANFEDLNKVGLAFTTDEELGCEIQVYANLNNYSIEKYLGTEQTLVSSKLYSTLDELIEKELVNLDFSDLVYLPDDETIDELEVAVDGPKAFMSFYDNSDPEIALLYRILNRHKINDVELDRNEKGEIVAADDWDNKWTGAELYSFLVNEVFIINEDGTVDLVDGELLEEFKKYAAQNGVEFSPVDEVSNNVIELDKELQAHLYETFNLLYQDDMSISMVDEYGNKGTWITGDGEVVQPLRLPIRRKDYKMPSRGDVDLLLHEVITCYKLDLNNKDDIYATENGLINREDLDYAINSMNTTFLYSYEGRHKLENEVKGILLDFEKVMEKETENIIKKSREDLEL